MKIIWISQRNICTTTIILFIVEQIIMREHDKIVTKSLYVTYKLLCLLCKVIQYYFFSWIRQAFQLHLCLWGYLQVLLWKSLLLCLFYHLIPSIDQRRMIRIYLHDIWQNSCCSIVREINLTSDSLFFQTMRFCIATISSV